MVGDEELDDRAAVLGEQSHALHQFADQWDALGHVAVALGLADVVQQHAEHEQLGLLHLVEHLGGALRLADWPGASASRCSTASSECWSAENLW